MRIIASNHISSFPVSAIVPAPVVPTPNQHKAGPVVTKYAVPQHVLAQMKARGVNGTTAVIPSAPLVQPQSPYVAQHPGWQQWQGHPYPQGVKGYAQNPTQTMTYPGSQNTNLPTPPASATFQVPLSATRSQYEALPAPPPNTNEPQDGSSSATDVKLQGIVQDADHKEASPVEDVGEEGEEEDDFNLLDIPDLPKSYGTSSYIEPKLVSKPVYSVAPEWTSSGFGEVTLSEDPEGRTESDYIRPDEIGSNLNTTRTLMQDMDPIFAVIDLDAPATASKPRSRSKDSGKSELETPHSYGSGDTRPTSVDEFDDYTEGADGRPSRSVSPSRRSRHVDVPPRHHPENNPKQNKRRDRGGRGRDWRNQARPQDRKRKRDNTEEQHRPQSKLDGPSGKKHQPSTTVVAVLESGNPSTDVQL